jgi:hypothetical protein
VRPDVHEWAIFHIDVIIHSAIHRNSEVLKGISMIARMGRANGTDCCTLFNIVHAYDDEARGDPDDAKERGSNFQYKQSGILLTELSMN